MMGWLALFFFFVSVVFTMKTLAFAPNVDKITDGRKTVETGIWLTGIAWTATAFFANWFSLITLSS